MVSFTRQSRWYIPDEAGLPDALRSWLLEQGSITERLRRANQHFSLDLLGHQAVSLQSDEQALLATEQTHGTCRQVILYGDQGPAVLGATLFSEAANLQGGLSELGLQPLGDRIFSSTQAVRDHLQLAQFSLSADRHWPAMQVWGRRSRLFLGPWPLLVHELFLPSL